MFQSTKWLTGIVNSFFADNGLEDLKSFLYFPADALQMVAIVNKAPTILYVYHIYTVYTVCVCVYV